MSGGVTRLQQVAWDYIRADECLRKALLSSERHLATIVRLKRLMRPAAPARVALIGFCGKEIHSVPLGMTPLKYVEIASASAVSDDRSATDGNTVAR